MDLVLRRAERLGSIFMHARFAPVLQYTLLTSRRSALAQDHILASACTTRLLLRDFTRANGMRCKIDS